VTDAANPDDDLDAVDASDESLTLDFAPEPEPEPEPEPPCAYCYRSPCIGESHPAYLALHPAAARRRADDYADAVMERMLLGLWSQMFRY
jgi:hypothetical protein